MHNCVQRSFLPPHVPVHTPFFEITITIEVYDIIQQIIALKKKHEQFFNKIMCDNTMFVLPEYFGEQIYKWPSYSADLSLLDFFLRSYLKNIFVEIYTLPLCFYYLFFF